MGLVAQAPIDTLFAPLAAMPGAATPPAETADGDLFAALLASLTADIPIEAPTAESGPAAAPMLPLVAGEAVDDDETNDGAMSAAVAALQLLPQLTPILPGPLAGGQAPTGIEPSTEAPVATANIVADIAVPPGMPAPPEAGVETAPAGELPAPTAEAVVDAARPAVPGPEAQATETADTPQPATTAPATAPAVPTATVTTQPEAEHQRATPATPARESSPAVAATPAGPAMVVVTANRVRRDERRLEREDGDPPATEASSAPPPGTQATTNSVVRFDGNADNQGRSNGQQDSTSKEGNEPNASVQGIAHAAVNSAAGELRTADAAPVADVPQPEPAATAAPEAVEHVGRTIIEKVEQGGGEARLHLRPEALGEVTLHIHTNGDQVRVEIHAERAEAANLLRDHTRDLSQLLGERGLNLADVHVDLGWQGPQSQPGEQPSGEQRRPRAEDNGFASLMGLDEPSPAERHNRLRSAYNPDGALSYRV